jgi:hypothetical protein
MFINNYKFKQWSMERTSNNDLFNGAAAVTADDDNDDVQYDLWRNIFNTVGHNINYCRSQNGRRQIAF